MPCVLQQAGRDAAEALRRAGIEDSQREALVLVGWALDLPAAAVLADPQRKLSVEQQARLRDAVRRRAAREPFAYIAGRAEFYGLTFQVDCRVMVPRPETEHVVEQALAIARAIERPVIADIGTGSGCIAVALAHTLERALVYATDICHEALAVAAANVRRHSVEHRVRLLQGDLLEPVPEPVHLIVSNPPYIATDEFAHLMPEVRDFEPRRALDGGEDGLTVTRRLIQEAPGCLRRGGALVVEIAPHQAPQVLALAQERFLAARIERDLADRDRVLVAQSPR